MIKNIIKQSSSHFNAQIQRISILRHYQNARLSLWKSYNCFQFCKSINKEQIVQQQKNYGKHIKSLLNKYPFCILPKVQSITSEQHALSDQNKYNLLSFQALFTLPAKRQRLDQIQTSLLGISQNKQQKTGEQIFTKFHMKNIQKIINQINKSGQLSFQQVQTKLFALQVLCNLLISKQLINHVKKIDFDAIKNNISMQCFYLKALVKCNLPYVQVIEYLFKKLAQPQNKNQQSEYLQACKILVSIDKFNEILPRNLIDRCLQKFTKNIQNISATDLWMILKFIYVYNSDAAQQFINKLSDFILQAQKNGQGSKVHIPLVLKVIKYRSKIGLTNQMFQNLINSNPQRFQTVFYGKNTMNKQKLMSIISQKNNERLPSDFKNKFSDYITKALVTYSSAQQIDQIALIRDLKLLIKYINNVGPMEIQKIRKCLINQISPKFQQQSTEELKYYLFLSISRSFKKQSKQSFPPKTLQYLKSHSKLLLNIYHSFCLNGQMDGYYEKLINVCYQLYRLDLSNLVQIPDIYQYKFSRLVLSPQCYNNFFYLLKKTPFPKSSKLGTFASLKKDIGVKLDKGELGIKAIYTLIDSLNRMDYDQDKYVYVDIQKGIAKQLQKMLEKNIKDLPLPKDIWFLKTTLVQKNRCSQKFKKFILEASNNHQSIEQYSIDYIKLQKDWINMRNNRKKNNENGQYEKRDKNFKYKNENN